MEGTETTEGEGGGERGKRSEERKKTCGLIGQVARREKSTQQAAILFASPPVSFVSRLGTKGRQFRREFRR